MFLNEILDETALTVCYAHVRHDSIGYTVPVKTLPTEPQSSFSSLYRII